MLFEKRALRNKILEMYPEIKEHNLKVKVDLDEQKNAYLVEFRRGDHRLLTHIEKEDAEDCLKGVRCIYLGVQVAQFIKNFEERVIFGRRVA